MLVVSDRRGQGLPGGPAAFTAALNRILMPYNLPPRLGIKASLSVLCQSAHSAGSRE